MQGLLSTKEAAEKLGFSPGPSKYGVVLEKGRAISKSAGVWAMILRIWMPTWSRARLCRLKKCLTCRGTDERVRHRHSIAIRKQGPFTIGGEVSASSKNERRPQKLLSRAFVQYAR